MSEHYVIELRAEVERLVQQLAASEAENERLVQQLARHAAEFAGLRIALEAENERLCEEMDRLMTEKFRHETRRIELEGENERLRAAAMESAPGFANAPEEERS